MNHECKQEESEGSNGSYNCEAECIGVNKITTHVVKEAHYMNECKQEESEGFTVVIVVTVPDTCDVQYKVWLYDDAVLTLSGIVSKR